MFLPISDDNPSLSRPLVTWALLISCTVVFLWQLSLPPSQEKITIHLLGMIPAVLFGFTSLPQEAAVVTPWVSLFTSMFLHGNLLHLGGNMLYLWIFGDNVEDSMGRARFFAFYLLCGVTAALTQALIDPRSEIPMIGASGAIAGVLGAYLMLHPRANVKVMTWFLLLYIINVPAFLVLGVWIFGQFLAVPDALTSEGGIAYFAHIGGFIAGMVLVPLFRKRRIGLFQAAHSKAFTFTASDLRARPIKERSDD